MSQNLSQTQKQQLLAQIVAVAKSQLGVTEQPLYSNWGNIVRNYLAAVGITSPASWCMAFAYWTVKAACSRVGVPVSATTLVATGYCPTQVEHARGLGTLISATDVATWKAKLLPGYLMVEMIPSEGGYHHTGVVTTAPSAAGDFDSCEGNSNTSGSSEGYEVCLQHRNIHQKASDGSAKYAFIATA